MCALIAGPNVDMVEVDADQVQQDQAAPLTTSRKRKRSRRYTINHIKLRNIEDPDDPWFDIWWLGYNPSTPQSYKHLLAEGVDRRELDTVMKKGLKAQRTTWGGLTLRSGRECNKATLPLGAEIGFDTGTPCHCQHFTTEIKVKFHCQQARCVPYSFLNVVGANKKKKDKLIRALGAGLCSLRDLCNPVQMLFKKTLVPVDKDLAWILKQTSGVFLVFDTIHCVGVDCEKKLIYDSSLKLCLKLCEDAFAYCNILKAEEVRQV
jgi:hypothetical protein